LSNALHFGRWLGRVLALQPDLERVDVVGGAGPDRSYENQARAEFRPFEGRVDLTYFSGLVMRDLEQRFARR
jgi:hypothetical protein